MTQWCGDTAPLFVQLNEWISSPDALTQSIVFPYGKQYGWAIAHRKKTKLICNVFPECGALTIMTHLSDKQFQAVYPQLSDYAKRYVNNRYPCGDGGWIHYRISSPEHMADIQSLLTAKMHK